MKTYKLLLTAACCLITLTMFGQREETVFGRTGGLTGAWGAPVYTYSQFGDADMDGLGPGDRSAPFFQIDLRFGFSWD